MDIQTIKRHATVTQRLIVEQKAAIERGAGNPDRIKRLRREASLLCDMRRRHQTGIKGPRRTPASDVKALWNDYLDALVSK